MNTILLDDSSYHAALLQTEQVIRAGGIAAVPTDTIYGLAGDATDERVLEKLFALKQRPKEKPFPIFVKDIAAARWFAYISDAKARFLEKVWPGAVTVLFDHKGKIPMALTAGRGSIGMRIPDHRFVRGLLEKLPFPLVETSANVSGRPPAENSAEVKSYFPEAAGESDFFIVDAGPLEAVPSAVVDFTRDEPIIVRSGMMSKKELDMLLYPA